MLESIRSQQTAAGEACLEGRGLHSGEHCRLRMKPAPPGSGIVFVRKDLSGSPRITARPENVISTVRAVDLGRNGDKLVRTVEHLLAACAGLNIDNLLVEMEGPEVPAGDGSALTLVEKLESAGIREQDEELMAYRPEEKLGCHQQENYLIILPAGETSYHYQLDYGERPPGRQLLSFFPEEEDFAGSLAPARTFVLEEEIKTLKEKGLARGGSRENAVIFSRQGAENELRFSDEAARHKLLDLMGDLFLAGPVLGRIIAVRSGHTLNHRLARILHKERQRELRKLEEKEDIHGQKL